MRKRTKFQAGEDLRGVAIYARKSRITNKGDSIGVQFKQSADYAVNQLSLPEDYEFLHYQRLLELVRDKDYFVLTTNVDHCFQRAGFDKTRLFYTQGDYGLFQCSEPCCQETWDNEEQVRRMLEQQWDLRVPSELIPRCPRCGRPLTMNLRADDRFVEDGGWHAAAGRCAAFLRRCRGKRVLFLELGVGWNTPGIIKYPFWRMTAENPDARYACVNYGQAVCPREIGDRAVCIDGDVGGVLAPLAGQNIRAAQ